MYKTFPGKGYPRPNKTDENRNPFCSSVVSALMMLLLLVVVLVVIVVVVVVLKTPRRRQGRTPPFRAPTFGFLGEGCTR